jgi:hypothetical protein
VPKDHGKKDKQSYADTVGIAQIPLPEVHKFILSVLAAGGVPCLHGESAIGKTASAKPTAAALGAVLIERSVPHMSSLDFGIPFRDPSDSEFFKMLLPPWVKEIYAAEAAGKPSLVFFDEITRYQDRETGSALFGFVGDRTLFGKKLPKDCHIMAACNPDNGDYAVNTIMTDPAWRRRLRHAEVTVCAAGWLRHAREEKFHPWVTDFVTSNIDLLLDEKARNAGKVFASPAAWEGVSTYLKSNEDSLYLTALASYVGYSVASAFISYTEDSEFKLSPRTVVSDWPATKKVLDHITASSRGDLITRLVTSVALYLYAEAPNVQKVAKPISKFWAYISAEAMSKFATEIWAHQSQDNNYYALLMAEVKKEKIWEQEIYDQIKHCLGSSKG